MLLRLAHRVAFRRSYVKTVFVERLHPPLQPTSGNAV
jgi:hypothetical protein